jgi:hypothetical protein
MNNQNIDIAEISADYWKLLKAVFDERVTPMDGLQT